MSGEGSFMIRIIESSTHSSGFQVGLRFQITQHSKEKLLMESIMRQFNCGYLSNRGDVIDFKVTAFSDIQKIIIPFFDKHTILGVKQKDFQDFKLAAQMISNKEHLTEPGILKIREIKSKMNKQRKN